ncbi:TIR domain-containing protein [uncultured Duncaniella sp.]|uniref:TIR domain-containing protein n=1 Tax=uncultured Duncaniella sp. TaxID=2768039 RepID=UPI0025B23A79|nr:TIR domain-containing protein [uncultured Duncaniella sp.]
MGGFSNREYIRDKISAAFDEMKIDIVLLEDSRGSTGAPNIPNAILTKIIKSDIFICDVTPAHTLNIKGNKKRALPNPNVMFELGFAVRSLGWERIICVCNGEYGDIETLPG